MEKETKKTKKTKKGSEKQKWKHQQIWTQFALEYANTGTRRPLSYWTKRYNVSMRTISRWLNREDVQEIIREQRKKIEENLQEVVKQYAVEALQELYSLMKMRRKDETKRKACNDILGLAKFENINIEGNTKINLNIDYSKLSDEQLYELYQRKLAGKTQDT